MFQTLWTEKAVGRVLAAFKCGLFHTYGEARKALTLGALKKLKYFGVGVAKLESK
ncbi:hypothetical protein Caka_1367 [Coraliomargarita akajimensis DSM 45221]|uniref:Uncharacterized protein n=1 Tax=Coraliomargarita akajimensis (strain DSM 45221 / IAM 15411 / JCM 23193 / KCTC 12865 / 04OKA010-24) TaxID=583355 RepID=D5EIY7_CORAD|nr:hypothetical protein Caka_1367 [Coraliomargarita akajimensis DSM 45221]